MPPKKGGKKQKDDDWDDDKAEKKLAALQVKNSDDAEWDDEEDDAPVPAPKKKGMSAFAMLGSDDDAGSDNADNSEPEEKVTIKQEKPKQIKPTESKKPEKKKGKKEKKGADDDELDAILAELDKPVEKTATAPKGKKAKKDEVTTDTAPVDTLVDAGEANPLESVVEEENKNKKKKKDKKKAKTPEASEGAEPSVAERTEEPINDDDKEEEEGETEEGGDDKKKKKKKDKKKKKEEKEDKPKKKGQVNFIKELLRAKQEAEEKALQQQQEEERRLEELARVREEKERIEREKKEATKQKKKDAIERQKAEGTYKTAAQREKERIAAAKLAAAGIVRPAGTAELVEKKKPVIYLDKRQLKKKQEREEQLKKQQEEENLKQIATTPSTETRDTPKLDAKPTEKDEEPLDDWEMAEDEPEIETAQTVVTAEATPRESADNVDDESSSEESSEEDSSDEESSDSSDEEEEEEETYNSRDKEKIAEIVRARIKKRREAAEAKRTTDDLRAPVICVLGHVDTGKTKMLDTIRRTNVQDGEAGGITQQIGATQVPADAIKERCKQVRDFVAEAMKIPGFLIIDTPGHESFSNLRSRGSSLCDFAILVVDIMHGLEPQTIESLKLLLKRETPFVVALNKIDRLYGYESNPRRDVYQLLKSQKNNVLLEYKERVNKVIVEFAEQGINVALSNENPDPNEYISMVPTSAFLGDGIGNLMAHIVETTQTKYAQKLAFSEELDATVMEVKSIPGLGTTIDVILVNGRLNVGDVIVLTGTEGAIMTPIRELLMPQPLRELRVKNEYQHFKEIRGAQGVKVLAKNLEKSLAGLPVFVAHKPDEVDVLKEEAEAQLSKALMSIKKKPEGVYVQASTLGSLEALLEFLRTQKIPYSNVNIGPVHKKDVQKAAVMLEHKPEYACILSFDVKVERDAQIFADKEGVKIFQADIIYHLEDNFLKYREELRLKARRENEHLAIFPCRLRIMPQHVFNQRNPIVVGVEVEAGQLKRGTPICVPSKDNIFLGTVSSIEYNHEEVNIAKTKQEVCIKIENTTGEAPKLYGRHFTHEDHLVSRISRESIDACKNYFKEDLSREDWQLIVQLKRVFDII